MSPAGRGVSYIPERALDGRVGRAHTASPVGAAKSAPSDAVSAPMRAVSDGRLARMTRQLWAPWRLEYITQADEETGCIFCRAAAGSDEEGLVVRRGEHAFALLNKFPYASGHLMVASYRHVGEFGDLTDEEALEVHRLGERGFGALAEVYGAQGYNLGWNLGRIAGAGVVDHVHLHVVPRWAGDTNFMPVLAGVKVLPEHLLQTRSRLAEAWPG